MGRRNTAPPSGNQPLTLSPSTRRPLASKQTTAEAWPPATMSPMPVAVLAGGRPASSAASGARSALPTRRISAAATPSGYGRSLCTSISLR